MFKKNGQPSRNYIFFSMPKLYEYFGLIILFYSNEHQPIHVHGKFQNMESKAEFYITEGIIDKIVYKEVKGKKPLNGKELLKFKLLVGHFKKDIIQKWVDFFILNKEIRTTKITKKLD